MRWICLGLLGLILFSYTQCGAPYSSTKSSLVGMESNTPTPASTLSTMGSVEAFEKTVYPITRKNCIGCHQVQQPVHASSNSKEAHDALINQSKVNFSNPVKSRIVDKIDSESHGCWGNCQSNSQEMLAAVQLWYQYITVPQQTASTAGSTNNSTKSTTSSNVSNSGVIYPNLTANSNTLGSVINEMKKNSITLNANVGQLRAPFELSGNPLSITTSAGTANNNNANSTTAGEAQFTFAINTPGMYQIWGTVNGLDNNSDAFYVKVDNGNYFDWYISTLGTSFSKEFVSMGTGKTLANFNLTVGNHTLYLKHKDAGAKLANFTITPTLAQLPIPAVAGSALLRFPLNSFLNGDQVYFQIFIEDFDEYSYKLSKPHFYGAKGSIGVKNIKPVLNGFYNIQNSTYTYVDATITPTQPLISQSEMIVLKDKGSAVDTLAFSFGAIAYKAGTATSGTTTATTATISNPISFLGNAKSIQAFQGSLYSISRTYCIGCHQNTFPRHANSTPSVAHDDLLQYGEINFLTTSSSKIVLKVGGGHYCWSGNCTNDSNSIKTAIDQWLLQIK